MSKKKKEKLFPTPIANKDFTLNLPKPHLSFSQIDCYLNCPEQYRRRYVLGIKEPPGPPLCEGQTMAKTLADVNTLKLRGETCSVADTARNYGKHCSIETLKLSEKTRDEILNRGLAFIEKYVGQLLPQVQPTGVETEIKTEIAGVPILGYCDLEEEDTVTDFKVARDSRYYHPETSLQLMLYATELNKQFMAFWIFQKKDGKIVSKDAVTPKHAREWVAFIVGTVAKGISQEVFTPRTSFSFCSEKFCFHWNECAGAV